MVTSLSVPQQPKRASIRQPSTASQKPSSFSQSSPNMDPPSSMPRLLAKPYGKTPFLSPNSSETWSTDDETGSSSGQDEFHLERYSQDSEPKFQRPFNDSGRRAKKARRPDLNIVTELPGSQARALGSGIVIEQVKAKKAATSRPKSVVSAKAEHVHDRLPPHRSNALAGLKETARLRHEKNKAQRDLGAANHLPELSAGNQVSTANSSRVRDRSNQKPVVIGISIPRKEAEAQKYLRNDDSAVTLRTPSIVITPAEVEAPWTSSPPSSRRKPASGFHSAASPTSDMDKMHDNLPPVPQMPATFSNFSRPSGKLTLRKDSEGSNSSWDQRDSEDSLDGGRPDPPLPQSIRRFSSESQEQILPSEIDPARHKSQGWWNLMLSPMLSRAGTIKNTIKGSPTTQPPVPPLPSASDTKRSRSATLDSQISPETPRRLGLAGARMSTWSRWTTWEKQKNLSEALPGTAGQRADQLSTDHQVQHSGNTIPFRIGPSQNEGLAAEYYRACAIEQLAGENYFECIGHSCSEKLPALHSIFDCGTPVEDSRVMASSDNQSTTAPKDITHRRNVSGSTNALSPEDLSPNVRQADSIPVIKARAIGTDTPSLKDHPKTSVVSKTSSDTPREDSDRAPTAAPVPMPSPSRPQARYPNIAAIVPPQHPFLSGATVASPGPISPEMQRSMTAQGGVPMSEIRTLHAETPPQRQTNVPPTTVYNYLNYSGHEDRRDAPANVHINRSEYKPSPKVIDVPARRDSTQEETSKEAKENRPSLLSRLRSCAKARKANPSSSTAATKRRRWAILIFIVLLLMIVTIVALATQLTRRGDQTPTQQQWLNLTGYPPMPTGISTIIRPDLFQQQDQCISQSTLWSCSLPKEEHSEIAPNEPDQPNFRFEIKFRNGTVPSNMTIPINSLPTNAGNTKRANDPFTNELFVPNPPPPSRAEQIFLGNTTDNITSTLFEGEETPFYMTFIPTFPIDPNDPSFNLNSSTPTPTTSSSFQSRSILPRQQNFSNAIPSPSVQEDGSANPANLLPNSPYPFAQPIRLFNRGLQDEHYGFYTFFDKSIFLSVSTTANATTITSTSASDDTNGGAFRNQAKARCTFSQTRFLVRFYTNPSFGATLLPSQTAINNTNTNTNSATNYTPPGSFPYPTDIILDRHGGTFEKKLVYCYSMSELQVLLEDEKAVVIEDRGAGGSIVNPAPPIARIEGQEDDREGFEREEGGVDGGTGGCSCGWRNWT